ncbi:hypothetical protein J2M53_10225 [Arthrobacter sp. zg-ZUI100]|uniref:hypothetical protein n=1 Tax=Arthrobacter jiangjiafuii TaxID=2817475 RepID=UPI001AED9D69|nr:hypothetical protein [Arthrobacter jiangjiafuii]MBP3036625.1 hypothetical protein [Arthrobacter jiangjiafuii]
MHKVETLKFRGPLKALIIGAGIVIGGAIFVMGLSEGEVLVTAITGILVIGLSCAIVVLPKLETSTDGRQLVLNLSPVKRYIFNLSELESIQPTTINAASYGGIGLRFVPGTTGLIMKSGKGIELVHQGKRYVFSSDDPEKVLQELSVP